VSGLTNLLKRALYGTNVGKLRGVLITLGTSEKHHHGKVERGSRRGNFQSSRCLGINNKLLQQNIIKSVEKNAEDLDCGGALWN